MPLSPAAREFVRLRLGSLIQLDVALLLRADAEVWWTVDRVGAALQVSSPEAQRALDALASRNLLDVRIANDLSYRFAPWHDSAAEAMTEVAANPYEAREIAARAGAGSAAARFADAFRIRKNDG